MQLLIILLFRVHALFPQNQDADNLVEGKHAKMKAKPKPNPVVVAYPIIHNMYEYAGRSDSDDE